MTAASPRSLPLLMLFALMACQAPPARLGTSPGAAKPENLPSTADKGEAAAMSEPMRGVTAAIGGAFPTSVERAARDQSWLVYCQAPEDTDRDGELRVSVGPRGELFGDELVMYLAVGGSAPEPIEALWGVDSSERWLVVRQQGRAVIVDTRTLRRITLEPQQADLVESPERHTYHRALAFARGEAAELLYSHTTGRERFELRALALEGDGAPAAFPARGLLFQVRTSYDGAWRVIDAVERDSNQNGRLDLPLPAIDHPVRCHATYSSYRVWQRTGDAITTRITSSRTLQSYEVQDFAGPLGQGFLFRDQQGALFLSSGARRSALAPADCGAQVVHADAERGLALIACRGPLTPPGVETGRSRRRKNPPVPPRVRLPLWLVGENVSIDLGLELGPTGADRWAQAPTRLVPIHAGAERRLLDLDEKKLISLGPHDSVLLTFESRALLLRKREVELVDAVSDRSLVELTDIELFPQVVLARAVAFVSPYLLDLSGGRVLGKVSGHVQAVSERGNVLQTDEPVVPPSRLPRGPLMWRSPTRVLSP